MVAQYKPVSALELFQRFIAGESMLANPQNKKEL